MYLLNHSVQSIGGICLSALSVGELHMVTAAAGMLILLATVSFTLFLSAECKDTVNSMIIGIVFCILSLILDSVTLPNHLLFQI
ncbi:hypothetical protein AB8U03_12020 [Clostridium sp. Mt-5]|uniref:Uncharacterized protein n=1 Tax=Clostridium moutaii TaxID=3240932 RepID=A0ABV4BS74_9CLOT